MSTYLLWISAHGFICSALLTLTLPDLLPQQLGILMSSTSHRKHDSKFVFHFATTQRDTPRRLLPM